MDYGKVLLLFVIDVITVGAAQGCPTGFVTHGTSCYHFSHDTESWLGALQACRELDSQLVEINDAVENGFLKAEAKLLKTIFWIALSDIREEGTWVWMNSHTPLTSTGFSDWAPGQPNNYDSDENCATIHHQNNIDWQWNDYSCHLNLHYICEKTDEHIEVIG